MPKATRIHEYGGPEVLKFEEIVLGDPGPGEVRVRHTAIGVNYADTYLRRGQWPTTLPTGIGSEAAGIVEAVGAKVSSVRKGDAVVYMFPVPGAYAEQRVLPAAALVRLPKGVSDAQAAAVLLKGLTCWYLLRETYRVKRGDVVLLQAAAGGVGLIASQWARALGAKVIGAVGSAAKAKLAQRFGCHQVLIGLDDLPARVHKLTKGHGVDVVYDGVGKDSFTASLDSLRPRGLMVSYGAASGPTPEFSAMELAKRGSLFFTRAGGGDYLADAKARAKGTRELFALLEARKIRVHIGQRYPLADAVRAHQDLESRKTSGSSLLIP